VPAIWQAHADPSGTPAFPSREAAASGAEWWIPLVHLLCFSLGWPRPDIGLRSWIDQGRPLGHPALGLIEAIWGRDLDVFCVWCWRYTHWFAQIAEALDLPPDRAPAVAMDRTWEERIIAQAGRDQPVGGGGDPLHLAVHAQSPIEPSTKSGDLLLGADRRAVLLLDEYRGWYRALHEQCGALPPLELDRSWRVDVIVRPVGWLGTFRRSRDSGRWFSGQHRFHELGIGTPTVSVT
jgi:hypothetical protein